MLYEDKEGRSKTICVIGYEFMTRQKGKNKNREKIPQKRNFKIVVNFRKCIQKCKKKDIKNSIKV